MEIKQLQAFTYIFSAMNYILNLNGNSYRPSIGNVSQQRTNGYSDYKNGIICIDSNVWDAFTNAIDNKDDAEARVRYGIAAGTIAHEVMHFYQIQNLTPERMNGFIIEGNMSQDPSKWTEEDFTKYWNLSIEIEAFAFGMLVEETLLFGKNVSIFPKQMNREKYENVYNNLKEKYLSRIEYAFQNLLK